MSEAALWERLRDIMTGRWHAQRHEDKYSKGIPDVSYGINAVDGWIELKFIERYVPNPDGAWDVPLDKFTPEQRNWLTQRTKYGSGHVFLMIQFGTKMAAIWRWAEVKPMLGAQPFNKILATARWKGEAIDGHALMFILTGD